LGWAGPDLRVPQGFGRPGKLRAAGLGKRPSRAADVGRRRWISDFDETVQIRATGCRLLGLRGWCGLGGGPAWLPVVGCASDGLAHMWRDAAWPWEVVEQDSFVKFMRLGAVCLAIGN